MFNSNLVRFIMIFSICLPLAAHAASIGQDAKKAETYTTDAAITAQVKAKIVAASDIPFNISVTTTNGIVFLDGKVDTTLQANKIIELASSVHGVKDVDDSKLAVTSSESFLDDAITTAKAMGKIMQLSSDKKIGDNDLHVETTNGVVHVFGTVKNYGDIGTVKNAIAGLKDVKDVKTSIEVTKKKLD